MSRLGLPVRALLGAACLAGAGELRAATYTWAGGTAASWTDSGVWGAGSSFPVADDIANVAIGAATTINMGEISVGRINSTRSSGTSNWNLVLGSSSATTDILTLSTTSGGPILDVGGGTLMFMYATLAGTQGFTKQGSGILTFRFNNTASSFTGNVTLAAGSIILQSDGSLGNVENDLIFSGNSTLEAGNSSGAAIELGAGRSLTVNSGVTATLRAGNSSAAPSNLTIAGAISGAGGVTVSSANQGFGTVTLSGANAYTGTTTVDRVTLILAGGNAIANSGTVNLNNLAGSVLQLNASESVGGLTGGGATGGTVNLQTFNLAVNTASNITYAGAFSGTSGKLMKQGSGTLTLTGAATHTGGVEISNGGGVLRIQNAGALGSGTINLGAKTGTNSGTLELALGGTNTFANAFANFASATSPLNGAATAHIRNVTGDNAFSGNMSIVTGGGNGINLESVAGGAGDLITFSGAVDNRLNDTRLLSLMGSGVGVVSGTLSSTGGASSQLTVYKNGAGTWTLSGANTHAGATQVAEGVIRVAHASALGATTQGTSVASGAALELQGGIAVGAEALSLAGSGVSSGGALRNIAGANSWAGNLTLAAAATVASDAGTLTISGGISGGHNLTLAGAGNLVLSGVVGIGTGTLTKSGAGSATLSAANTLSGAVTVEAGTLVLGDLAALGSGIVHLNGGVLDLGGLNPANEIRIAGGSVAGAQNWNREVLLAGSVGASTLNSLGSGLIRVGAGASVSLNGVTKDITLDGGSIDAFGDYAGTVTLASGTSFDLDGAGGSPVSISAGFVVSAGSTLSGSGTIGGFTSVAGTHAVGNSPGSQSFSSGLSYGSTAVVAFEYTLDALANYGSPSSRGVDFDAIDVTGGDLTIAPGAVIDLVTPSGNDFSAVFWDTARSFKFIDVWASGTLTGSFAFSAGSPVTVEGQGAWSLAYSSLGDNGVHLQWTPVPEPSTYGFLLGGLALAASALRRRRPTKPSSLS